MDYLKKKLPTNRETSCLEFEWAHRDSNPEPTDYESAALTVELWALISFDITIDFLKFGLFWLSFIIVY